MPRYLVFVVPFACLLAGAALAAVAAPAAALVVVVLAGLLGLPDQAALRRTHEWPRSAPVDYAGAARVIADGQRPGRRGGLLAPAQLALPRSRHRVPPRRPATRRAGHRGPRSAEATSGQPSARGRRSAWPAPPRVWLVVAGRHAEPLAAVPGAKGDALRAQFTVTQVWPRPGLTVALLTSRPDR